MRVSELPESKRQEMAAFFLRTSVPRILAERAKQKKEKELKNEQFEKNA